MSETEILRRPSKAKTTAMIAGVVGLVIGTGVIAYFNAGKVLAAVAPIGWGGFPAFTGYFADAEKVALPGVLMAAGCTALSVAQRRLSAPARELRRRTLAVDGTRTLSDGSTEQLSISGLLRPLDGALAAMSLAIVLTACALVIARL